MAEKQNSSEKELKEFTEIRDRVAEKFMDLSNDEIKNANEKESAYCASLVATTGLFLGFIFSNIVNIEFDVTKRVLLIASASLSILSLFFGAVNYIVDTKFFGRRGDIYKEGSDNIIKTQNYSDFIREYESTSCKIRCKKNKKTTSIFVVLQSVSFLAGVGTFIALAILLIL